MSLRQVDLLVVTDSRLRDERHIRDRHLQPCDELEAEHLDRFVELLGGDD